MKPAEERSERTLLAVAYFFPPLGGGGVQRTVKFLKYLRPLGWRSEVVTARARSYWVLDDTLAAEVPPDTVVHRTLAPTGLDLLAALGGGRANARAPRPAVRSTAGFRAWRSLAGFFLIPDAYAGWFPFALAAVRERVAAGGIDVLFTTSSPDTAHLVGLVVREQLGIPWVADFRDPWVRRLTFTAPTPLHARLQSWLEHRVLTRADRVIVTNEATRDDFLARHAGLSADKLVVIPNGYDPEDLAPVRAFARASISGAPVERGDAAALVLIHTGLLSGQRTLAPLVAAITALFARRPELRARLRVRQIGPRESVNEELVQAAGLGEVIRFEPPRPHAEVLAEMARAPALLLLEADEPRGSLITPGKIFEYLAVGRPILALVPAGPAADLVTRHGAGEVVSPSDAEAIARHLERWITHGPPPMPTPGLNLSDYARPALAAKLARVLDDLAVSFRG
jgi:glycosyltransferase involved in cell wall biosynthesis